MKLSTKWIPPGALGTRATLEHMRLLALADKDLPEIRSLAYQLGSPENLDAFLRAAWRFKPDPPEIEFIRTPGLQVAQHEAEHFVGDCDDAATLAACVLAAMGAPCSFQALRLPGESEFSHVLVCCSGHYLDNLLIDPIVAVPSEPVLKAAEVMEVRVWP